MNELRKAARALVLQVADGDEVSIEALRDFASLTLGCELVQLAQRVQEAPPEFAVRRAMELASLVLTLGAKPRAAEDSPETDVASDVAGGVDAADGEGAN